LLADLVLRDGAAKALEMSAKIMEEYMSKCIERIW
jgi:hypothetical protein